MAKSRKTSDNPALRREVPGGALANGGQRRPKKRKRWRARFAEFLDMSTKAATSIPKRRASQPAHPTSPSGAHRALNLRRILVKSGGTLREIENLARTGAVDLAVISTYARAGLPDFCLKSARA